MEWVNYEKPTWESHEALHDKKGRCLCPKVLKDWKAFQALLKSSVKGPSPCRIKRPLEERYEVSEAQLAAHGAFLASKARSGDTARSYSRLWNDVVGPYCRLFKCDPWKLSGAQVANLLVWREMTGKAHEVERLYNAIRVVYAAQNLSMPDSPLAHEVVKGAKRIHAEEKNDIDRVEFPISEFKRYCLSNAGRLRTRIRDKCLLAIGLRCKRRPKVSLPLSSDVTSVGSIQLSQGGFHRSVPYQGFRTSGCEFMFAAKRMTRKREVSSS